MGTKKQSLRPNHMVLKRNPYQSTYFRVLHLYSEILSKNKCINFINFFFKTSIYLGSNKTTLTISLDTGGFYFAEPY